MSDVVLKVENLSKVYRLGEVGTGTLTHDLNRWWARVRGKEDPFSTVGSLNDRTQKAQKGEYVKALSDINFEVKKGEVLGVIGKNGAGKSTLLKVISQITSPTTGSVKAKGRIASLLEVGTGMHPEMTGKENVYLNGTILGMTKREIDAKFEEIMDFAGCLKYSDTPVKRYSSGMKVRLGFAVAAFLEPEILIVDEVLAVGDAEFQKKAIGKMQDISAGGGRTVLFVSHNMTSVLKLCNRVLLLENGMVIKNGNPNEIVDYYTQNRSDVGRPKLSEISRRRGNGQVKLQSIRITDANSNELLSPLCGKEVRFEIDYSSELETIKTLLLGLGIYDKHERLVTIFSTNMANYHFNNVKGSGTLVCLIPKFPLMPGDYFITFTLKINSYLADQLQYAYRITVSEGDFYGSGKSNANTSRQGVYVDHQWKLI